MSLNARAALGFLLSVLPELSWLVVERVVPPVLPGILVPGLLALLWWQFSAGRPWAAWILAVLTAVGVFVAIVLGTTFWVLIALASAGETPELEISRVATFSRAACFLAAFMIAAMELRSRARL